jgi:hypothetical protein
MLQSFIISSLLFIIFKINPCLTVNPSSTKKTRSLTFLLTNNFSASHTIIYKSVLSSLTIANFSSSYEKLAYISSDFDCAFISTSTRIFVKFISKLMNLFYFFLVFFQVLYFFLKFFNKFFNIFR